MAVSHHTKTTRIRPRNDITGQRFGNLVALDYVSRSKWLCRCDCGKETIVFLANLLRSNTKSCGCMRNAASSKRNRIHGLYGTKVYRCWCSIKKRCNNPHDPSYPQYGGAGITMHAEWAANPKVFFDYIGHAPSEKHSIDRIDNTKGYIPGNIRWADSYQQANNKTSNRVLYFRGERYTLAQLARKIAQECGIKTKDFLDAYHSVIEK